MFSLYPFGDADRASLCRVRGAGGAGTRFRNRGSDLTEKQGSVKKTATLTVTVYDRYQPTGAHFDRGKKRTIDPDTGVLTVHKKGKTRVTAAVKYGNTKRPPPLP